MLGRASVERKCHRLGGLHRIARATRRTLGADTGFWYALVGVVFSLVLVNIRGGLAIRQRVPDPDRHSCDDFDPPPRLFPATHRDRCPFWRDDSSVITMVSADRPLTVVATDVATGRPALFSPDATPEMKIATAVRCSISIPGIFAARRLDGRTFVDGCLSRVEPQLLFADLERPAAVVPMAGHPTASPDQERRLSLSGYIRRVAQIVSDSVDALPRTDDWDHDLCVDVGPCPGFDFGQDPSEKQALHDLAYEQCRQFLAKAMSERCFRLAVPAWCPNESQPEEATAVTPESWFSIAGAYY